MEKLIEFCLIDIDWITDESNNPIIRLFGKTDEKSVLVLDRTRPYFYLIPTEGTNLERLKKKLLEIKIRKARVGRVEKVSEETKKEKGKEIKVLKVEVTHPADLREVLERVRDWEGVKAIKEHDIPLCQKYLIDRGITPLSKIRLVGRVKPSEFGKIDEVIELREMKESLIGQPKLKLASFELGYKRRPDPERDPIEMISIVSDQFERVLTWKGKETKTVEVLDNEKEMIIRFVEIIRELDPDLLIAYNSDLFGFPYLQRRARENGLELRIGKDNSEVRIMRRGRRTIARIKGRVHIDLFPIIENHVAIAGKLKSEVYTLDNIAYELLGEEERDKANLLRYCLEGSRKIMKLAKELLPMEYEFSNLTNQPLFEVTRMTIGQMLEWYLILNAHRMNELVPPKPEYEERVKRRELTYRGAIVFPPKVGLHEGIAIFDFHSLYPSIIISKNIDPSTIDCECCSRGYVTPNGTHHFCKQRIGLIPKVMEDVLSRRERVKKILERVEKDSPQYKILFARQHALKTIANASYGYIAFFGARWYDRECASSITAFGRDYIKKIIEMAGREFEVIYADTDSCFVKVKRAVYLGGLTRKAKRFVKKVNQTLPEKMKLEFRGVYPKGLFVSKAGELKKGAKKKYVLLDKSGEIEVRGFELVRRDYAPIAKTTQQKVIEAILKGSLDEAVKVVREVINDLERGDVKLEDLIIHTQLTKPISSYEQIGPHVAAAKKMLERGIDVGPESIVRYIITKGSGSISERAEPVNGVELEAYDPEYYIDHQVVPAALRILKIFDYDETKLKGKQKTLERFLM